MGKRGYSIDSYTRTFSNQEKWIIFPYSLGCRLSPLRFLGDLKNLLKSFNFLYGFRPVFFGTYHFFGRISIKYIGIFFGTKNRYLIFIKQFFFGRKNKITLSDSWDSQNFSGIGLAQRVFQVWVWELSQTRFLPWNYLKTL